MKKICPHCILKRIERRTKVKFSSDFEVGFICGVLFYKGLVKDGV